MEVAQTEVTSTAEDPTPKGGPQLALTDKLVRTRPRFDPTVEHTVGRKIAVRSARGRLTHQQPRQESRDSSADGVPTREEEQERRKRPPLPPPAPPKTAARMRSLTSPPPPPPRADSATESATSTPRNRGIMRLRTKEVDHPPQRTMPRRTATPIGGSTQQQPLATPQRQPQSEEQGQSRQWEDRAARDQSGGRWEQRDYQDRSRSSRQWQDDQQWTEQSQYTQGRQDWSSQAWTSRSTYRDTGSQHQLRDQPA